MRTALFTDKDRYDILPSRKPDPDPTSAFLQKRLKKAISTRVSYPMHTYMNIIHIHTHHSVAANHIFYLK